MAIRQATPADSKAFALNNVEMAKESENIELDYNTVYTGCNTWLNDPTKGFGFVYEVDGKVVGQLLVTFEWSEWRNRNMWWIQSVYVKPEFRKKGIFRKLYQYVKEQAITANAGGLRLYVDNTNVKAQSTYKSLGMTSHYAVYEESLCEPLKLLARAD